MNKFKAAIRSPALIAIAVLLGGCDKLKEATDRLDSIDAIKADAAASKQQVAALKAAIDGLYMRLIAVEANQRTVSEHQGPQPLSTEQVAQLNAAISACVQLARSAVPSGDYQRQYVETFDAFYNPATGRVQNNNLYNGGMPAVFAFNKCMNARGFPLS